MKNNKKNTKRNPKSIGRRKYLIEEKEREEFEKEIENMDSTEYIKKRKSYD